MATADSRNRKFCGETLRAASAAARLPGALLRHMQELAEEEPAPSRPMRVAALCRTTPTDLFEARYRNGTRGPLPWDSDGRDATGMETIGGGPGPTTTAGSRNGGAVCTGGRASASDGCATGRRDRDAPGDAVRLLRDRGPSGSTGTTTRPANWWATWSRAAGRATRPCMDPIERFLAKRAAIADGSRAAHEVLANHGGQGGDGTRGLAPAACSGLGTIRSSCSEEILKNLLYAPKLLRAS